MKAFWLCFLGTILCLSAVDVTAQTTTSPDQLTVIGCLQREAGDPGSEPKYRIDDFRAGSYRVSGDAEFLKIHAGHQVEVVGKLEERDESMPEAFRELKIEKLTYVSRTCWE